MKLNNLANIIMILSLTVLSEQIEKDFDKDNNDIEVFLSTKKRTKLNQQINVHGNKFGKHESIELNSFDVLEEKAYEQSKEIKEYFDDENIYGLVVFYNEKGVNNQILNKPSDEVSKLVDNIAFTINEDDFIKTI